MCKFFMLVELMLSGSFLLHSTSYSFFMLLDNKDMFEHLRPYSYYMRCDTDCFVSRFGHDGDAAGFRPHSNR